MDVFTSFLQWGTWIRVTGANINHSQRQQHRLFPGKWAKRIVVVGIVVIFILTFSACKGKEDILAVEVGYHPPIVPLRVSVNSWGEVDVSVTADIVTPLGVFDAGLIGSPVRYFDGVQNTLTIRIDNEDCIYDLNGENFKFDLQGNNYRLVNLETMNRSIFVELQGDAYTGCKQRSVVSARRLPPTSGNDLQCQGASHSYLAVGGRATVSVNQVSVHQTPSELAPLVRNKYLRQGRAVAIIDGPLCGRGDPGQVLFWKVQSEEITFSNGERGVVVGWVGEESGDVYLLRPQ